MCYTGNRRQHSKASVVMPENRFVTSNNIAADEFRRHLRIGTVVRLSLKQGEADGVLDVALNGITISATLTLKSGELVWSNTESAQSYPSGLIGLRSIIMTSLEKSMLLNACGRMHNLRPLR